MLSIKHIPVEKRQELYKKAKELHNIGIGYVKASKLLNLSRWTLANWTTRNQNPLSNMRLANLKPSKELSYIVGVMQGDGSYFKTSTNICRIALACKDLEFIKYYLTCLQKVLNRKFPFWEERNNFYKTQAGSKHLYEFLVFKSWLNLVHKFPREFIRGFLDSEGWVDITSRRVCAANTDLKTIQLTTQLLNDCKISTQKIQKREIAKRKPIYELRMAGKNNLTLFQKTIGFTIKRKNRSLKELLSRYEK